VSAWRDEWRQVQRFAVVGLSNTVVTYLMFVALAQVMDPRLAYTLVFAVGVTYSVVTTGTFVFGSRRRWSTSVAYALWYLGVYAVGLAVLHLARSAHMHSAEAGVVVIAVTAPLNYAGGRLVFRGAAQRQATEVAGR
jgi:putative flippase GtrA